MNKGEMKKVLAGEIGVSQKDAGIVIDAVLKVVKDGLVNDGKVTLVGFGSFVTATQAPRKARNPKTGEPIDVPAKTVVKFRPAAAFKELALGANLKKEDAEVEAPEAAEATEVETEIEE
jgi:DNA-binding protein HU-beta